MRGHFQGDLLFLIWHALYEAALCVPKLVHFYFSCRTILEFIQNYIGNDPLEPYLRYVLNLRSVLEALSGQ